MARADRPDCQLCLRSVSSQLPFCCATCSRNYIYQARLKNAQVLLQKEALGRDVERTVKASQELKGTQLSEESPSGNRVAYDKARAHRASTKANTRAAEQHIQALQEELDSMREEIVKRRRALRERSKLLEDGAAEMSRHKTRRDPILHSIQKTDTRAETLQKKTVHGRAYICREAARLHGLQQKRRRKDGRDRDTYYIGGLPIVDLQDLYSCKPEPLNASLVNIVYLLNQTTSYLSLRLPAELLLPTVDNPHPRILAPHSSHRQPAVPTPQAQLSSTVDPSYPSSTPSRNVFRPRTLYLDRPLMKLVAEDNVAYESCVEAISLLAYDIAWLCKAQGIDVCRKSWEEACNVGRNLWLLFGPTGAEHGRTLQKVLKTGTQAEAETLLQLGVFSHGTHHNFAAGVEADQLGLKDWKLGNATYLIKRVKDALLERKMRAEWEVLEEEAWGPPEEANTEPNGPRGLDQIDDPTQGDTEGEKDRYRSARGWMRVRSRNVGEGAA